MIPWLLESFEMDAMEGLEELQVAEIKFSLLLSLKVPVAA